MIVANSTISYSPPFAGEVRDVSIEFDTVLGGYPLFTFQPTHTHTHKSVLSFRSWLALFFSRECTGHSRKGYASSGITARRSRIC